MGEEKVHLGEGIADEELILPVRHDVGSNFKQNESEK